MSTFPASSPIKRLNFDILWRIFDINADVFEDNSALDTTLSESRVCHDWRDFLLSSTSLWAHVMDLDNWIWSSVEGSREMIRRTGTASLWVKTHSSNPYRRGMKDIRDTINENWERIQKLEITVYADLERHWKSLYRPAPHLTFFSIVFNHKFWKFENLLASLFGGCVPLLRDFRLKCWTLNITAIPWLHQLRSADISSTQLTLPQILWTLISANNLTNLQLNYAGEDWNTPSTLPVASLPQLKHLNIHIFASFTQGAVLLEHISISPSCSVSFSASLIQPEEIDDQGTFGSMIKAIASCVVRCLDHQVPQRLQLVITPSSFLLKVTDCSDGPIFMFNLNVEIPHTFPEHMLNMFVLYFSLPAFSKITFFFFKIADISHKISGLTAFIAFLPAVQTLSTDKVSLCYLRAYAQPKASHPWPSVVFPALKTLRLDSVTPHPEHCCKFDDVRDPVSTYVMARIAHGHAIDVIDFSDVTFDELPEMALLRMADGLKVIWRQNGVSGIQEYICGPGPRAPKTPVAV